MMFPFAICLTPRSFRKAYLFVFAAQRLALAAVGGSVELPKKWEKTQSREQAQKTRRVPTVSCTLCWAIFTYSSFYLAMFEMRLAVVHSTGGS
jgi:hypothetical protein